MISYNGKLMPWESMTLDISNRGFQYGDGIFETIISNNGEMKFQKEHWERMKDGLKVLKMKIPFTEMALLEMQIKLLEANDLMLQKSRMKLYIWRKPGGLYTPQDHETEFLLTAAKANNLRPQNFTKVGVGTTVHLTKTAFSHLKTISAMPYVMAGIEKQERDLEELILLTEKGYIAEASSSNICFIDVNNKMIYTPSLDTGCINGVSRRYMMENAPKHGFDVQEVMWNMEALNSSFSVFTINVSGINTIQKIEDKEMGDSNEGFKTLQNIFN